MSIKENRAARAKLRSNPYRWCLKPSKCLKTEKDVIDSQSVIQKINVTFFSDEYLKKL